MERLRDRVAQLEQVLGIDRSLGGKMRDAFGLEPAFVPILGMIYKREFVTRGGLYTVVYGGRPECEWPDERILDVQICKLRKVLKKFGITIKTKWGEGWYMTRANKANVRAALDARAAADAADFLPAARADLSRRRMAFLEGA